MNWLEFVASLVNSLAWPVAGVAVCLLFRAQLRQILDRGLTRLRLGPLEAEWTRAEQIIPPELRAAPPESSRRPDVAQSRTAEISPRTGILERFDELAAYFVGQVHNRGVDAEGKTTGEVIEAALAAGVIDETVARSLTGLRVMRNLAAHNLGETSAAKVQEFLALAEGAEYALDHRLSEYDNLHPPNDE